MTKQGFAYILMHPAPAFQTGSECQMFAFPGGPFGKVLLNDLFAYISPSLSDRVMFSRQALCQEAKQHRSRPTPAKVCLPPRDCCGAVVRGVEIILCAHLT